jgi:PAS domain S-box-containing protein
MVGPDSLPAAPAAASLREEVAFSDIPFRGIVEQSLAGVYVVLDERFMYANDTFAAMFGYRRDEFIGMRMVDLVTPDSVEEVMRNYWLRISSEVPAIHYVTKCLHRDGHVVHLELHASRVECRGRPALCGVALDVSERVRREAQLRQSREQLRELASYVNTSREEQRAMFAREVHDVLGGMLTSIKMDVTRILRRAEAPELEEIRSIGNDLVILVQETIDTARKISDESRPRILDAMGLIAAIRDALERFGARHGVETSLTMRGGEPLLSPGRTIQCYRIFQEALTNVARHADARTVSVRLHALGDNLEMQVEDDGRGVDTEAMSRGGIGLISMAERAREIGGTLELRAGSPGGTTVVLRVPLIEPGHKGDD